MNKTETELAYHFEHEEVTKENRFKVMGRVFPFHEQLALAKGRELEELHNNVEEGGEVVFAVLDGPEPKDIAVVVGRLKPVTLSGEQYRVYIRYLRAVAPDFQRHGVATALTDEIVERLKPDGFEGRTPNPYVYRADEKSEKIAIIHPIHRLHDIKTSSLMAVTLPETYLRGLDYITGRCVKAYPPNDQFRLFNLAEASERVQAIYGIITGDPIHAKLEEGDGTAYFEWVKERYRNQQPPLN